MRPSAPSTPLALGASVGDPSAPNRTANAPAEPTSSSSLSAAGSGVSPTFACRSARSASRTASARRRSAGVRAGAPSSSAPTRVSAACSWPGFVSSSTPFSTSTVLTNACTMRSGSGAGSRFPGSGSMRRTVAQNDTTVKALMVAGTKPLVDPTLDQVLAFCAEDPIERVYLEEMARHGPGRLVATADIQGRLTALCHLGANVVPSGQGAEAFADVAISSRPKMLIGNEAAVSALWAAVRDRMPVPREDRPAQPVFAISKAPEAGDTEIRPARRNDLDLLLPACAATHEGELGVDPLLLDAEGFRRRTLQQIEEGRSWLWTENGTILFKAEASAWTPSAVQLQQVWVDPSVRNRKYAQRGMRDLCRALLERVPTVCLFVRADNPAAIRVYERVGMARA